MSGDSACATMTSPRQRHYHPLGTEERHQLDQQLQEQRLAALEAERDRAFAHKYTFRPKLTTPRPLPTAPHTTAADNVVPPTGHDTVVEDPDDVPEETLQSAAAKQTGSVFHRLAAKAAEREARQRQREEAHRARQAEAERSAFRPHLNPRSKALAEKAMGLDTLPVQERLLQYGRNVSMSHAAQQREAKEKEASTALSSPGLLRRRRYGNTSSASSIALSTREFDERNEALLEQRQQRQRQAAAVEPGAFQPKICTTSALLDAQRRRRLRIETAEERLQDALDDEDGAYLHNEMSATHADTTADRAAWLYADAQRSQAHKAEARQASLQREEQEVFHGRSPQTNPLSDAWIARGAHQRLFSCDFVTRQELYQRAQETERRLQMEAEAEAERTASLMQTPGKASPREVEAQVRRLHDRALERSAQQHRRLAEKVRADENCTFAPQLSPGTRHVVRQMQAVRESNVVKRLTQSTSRSQSRQRESRENSAGEQSGRSPSATSSAARRAVTAVQADVFYRRQLAQVGRRDFKMDMARKEKTTEDLLQCTFRPRTNADRYYGEQSAQPQRSNTPVSGVTAFLQRQAEAKRMREEKAERERNVGRGRPHSPHHRTTRIHPFTFTADLRIKRLGSQTKAAVESSERSFLANLSTNKSTRALSLPPKLEHSAPPTPRSRSAMKLADSDDRKNLSVSFADSTVDIDAVDGHTAPHQEQHSDPYDIQSLMAHLRQD